MGTAAVPQPDHSKKWLSDPGLRWKAASDLVAFYIVSMSNNQKIVEVLYGCQSERNQREQIIILIIIATFASNLFDMRVCSKSPQTGAIIRETVMRLLGAGGENSKCTRLCHVVCRSLHSSLTPTHLHAEQSPRQTDKTSTSPSSRAGRRNGALTWFEVWEVSLTSSQMFLFWAQFGTSCLYGIIVS